VTVHPALGMLLVGASFAALIVGLRALRDTQCSDPELLRKLLHIGMGVVSLSLPWLFHAPRLVLLLAGVFAIGLLAGRSSACCRRIAGGILWGIRRPSVGDLCFPAAVAAVFVLSAGHRSSFCIPVLTLTLADAAAALVGTRHGAHRFGKPGREKSLEGSAAFFLVALPCAYVPLRLWPEGGWAWTLLLSLNLAVLLTLVEALAGNGLDNLTVPFAALLLLRMLSRADVWLLAACATVAAAALLCFACRGVRGTPVAPTTPEVIHETV
jgi:phytol kinase